MHTDYGVYLVVGLRELGPGKVHAIQDHRAGEDHHMTSGVDHGKIIAQVAPGEVHQGKLIVLMRYIEMDVCTEFPFFS